MADAIVPQYPLVSRDEAKAANLNKFFTGIPCANGHIAQRYTLNKQCVECLKAASEKWARENPDKYREHRTLAKARSRAKPKGSVAPKSARQIARETGQIFYRTDKPCVQGHLADRKTETGECVECKRLRKFKYRAEHKQQISAYNKAYASANAERIEEYRKPYRKDYYIKNKSEIKEKNAEWYSNNKERAAEYFRSSYLSNPTAYKLRAAKYAIANPEKRRQYCKKWASNNPHKAAATSNRRRAAKRFAMVRWANLAKIEEFYFAAAFLRMVTGEWYHVDHIVPLISDIVCGLHCEANLRITTAFENRSKGNRYWPDMP